VLPALPVPEVPVVPALPAVPVEVEPVPAEPVLAVPVPAAPVPVDVPEVPVPVLAGPVLTVLPVDPGVPAALVPVPVVPLPLVPLPVVPLVADDPAEVPVPEVPEPVAAVLLALGWLLRCVQEISCCPPTPEGLAVLLPDDEPEPGAVLLGVVVLGDGVLGADWAGLLAGACWARATQLRDNVTVIDSTEADFLVLALEFIITPSEFADDSAGSGLEECPCVVLTLP
jgi:hypothetical protein